MPTASIFSLDAPQASDPRLAGAKAAALAAGVAAGLPVLPGAIVPISAFGAVRDAVRPHLERGSVGALRRAAMAATPSAQVLEDLSDAVAAWPGRSIVRSSSPLEGDGLWSGAFSSLLDVDSSELGTAVRACWGSAFSPDALDRAQHAGLAFEDLELAVLVQPELAHDVGGTARVDAGDRVTISATSGPLRALMDGWVEGETVIVGPGDARPSAHGIPDAVLDDVVTLSRATRDLLGHDLIEWAAADGDVWLLQALRSRAADPSTSPRVDVDLSADVVGAALKLVRLTDRFPGPLGEELVLPWAVAHAGRPLDPSAPTEPGLTPSERLAKVRSDVGDLVARTWGGSPRSAREEAARCLRQLRGTDLEQAVARILTLPDPPDSPATSILAELRRLSHELAEAGLVPDQQSFWRLAPHQLNSVVEGDRVDVPSRLGVDRWEPFIHAVVSTAGDSYEGVSASSGAGAGPVHIVDDVWNQPPPVGRYVLVAASPIPALSPLLWNAAGLVTRGGGQHAHLLEFAASIGVPSVVGVALPELSREGSWFAAVDGDLGRVSLARVDRVSAHA